MAEIDKGYIVDSRFECIIYEEAESNFKIYIKRKNPLSHS
jgi:hypothetical protein